MKAHRGLLIIAAAFVVVGMAICGVSFALMGCDFGALSMADYVTNETVVSDTFSNVSIKVDTSNVKLVPSEDDTVRVVCYEDDQETHDVRVESDTLAVSMRNSRQRLFGFHIQTKAPSTTVYLPKESYGDLSIETDTGEVSISGLVFERMEIQDGVGDVIFDACDAGEISVTTDTGDVTGTLLTEKVFYTHTDTGSVNVPRTTTGGRCEITTDTGDIEIDLP